MADKKYLDENGLIRFAAHLIDKFAAKTHNHDDAYYTETEIDTKIAGLQSSIDSVDGAVDNITSGTVVVKESEHATSADSATTATNATNATNAKHAESADSATTAANADHATTADSATSAGTADKVSKTMTVQLNGGTTEGTNKFTYNGSAAKSINITPSSIGAQAAGNYAASSHTHDDMYYTEAEIDSKVSALNTAINGKAASSHAHEIEDVDGLQAALDGKASSSHTHTVDSSLSGTSTNPVQNKVVNSALSGKVPTSRTVNGKALSSNITLSASDVGADASGSANTALTNAKAYTDQEIANLLENSTEAVDSIYELRDAMSDNADAITALQSVAASKANASDLTSHTGNGDIHVTATQKTNWNSAYTHSTSAHAPSDAEKNQNAFSNVVVGSTTIAADTATDSLTLVAGGNVTITPDATNDKITIAATDTVYTHPTSGVAAGTYKSVTVDANGHVTKGTNPTTLSGYGITDAAAKTHSHAIADVTNLQATLDSIDAKLDYTNIAYGTCDTAAATAAKVVTLTGNTSWELAAGSMVTVKFTATNTAASPTLNVNSTGAYPIWYNNAEYTSASSYGGYANRPITYQFDGSHWVFISWSYDSNSDTKVQQNAAITTAGEYPVILAYSTATSKVTNAVNKTSTLKYNPNTKILTAPTFKGALDGNATSADSATTLTGLTATVAELNILDGVTATAAELNKLDGVTATTAELNYVDGVTSNIQTQLDALEDTKAAVQFVTWEDGD